MEYFQLKIDVKPFNGEISEILIAELADIGYEGFFEDEKTLHAYIPGKDFREDLLENILSQVHYKPFKIDFSGELLPDKNWNQIWESGYEPVIIDNICMIRTDFHPPQKVENTIIIEPKMSFGTGHHETTRLMIRQIYSSSLTGKNILDMGCGTGILGIFALQRGAASVTAIDIDEWACNNSLENFIRNVPDTNFQIIYGNASNIPDKQYDIILANINRNILLEDMIIYKDHLNDNGKLIISGIMESDKESITVKANSLNLLSLQEYNENNWISLKFRLKN